MTYLTMLNFDITMLAEAALATFISNALAYAVVSLRGLTGTQIFSKSQLDNSVAWALRIVKCKFLLQDCPLLIYACIRMSSKLTALAILLAVLVPLHLCAFVAFRKVSDVPAHRLRLIALVECARVCLLFAAMYKALSL